MFSTSRPSLRFAALALVGFTAAACDSDSSTGPLGTSPVSVRFSTALADSELGPPVDAIVVGSNGSIDITSLQIIVAEMEFEADEDVCDEDRVGCEETELPPLLVDLPIDGSPLTVGTVGVPAGVYEEFELEVEDLDDDEDDPELAAAIAVLRSEILNVFPDWPDEASVRVAGTFTEVGSDPEPFVVYLDAEVEVERELVPPLVVGEDGSSAGVEVVLMPELWFIRGDGTVVDLRQYDFETWGRLLELEVEVGEGIDVEIDDD
jgi:hypothetical protein